MGSIYSMWRQNFTNIFIQREDLVWYILIIFFISLNIFLLYFVLQNRMYTNFLLFHFLFLKSNLLRKKFIAGPAISRFFIEYEQFVFNSPNNGLPNGVSFYLLSFSDQTIMLKYHTYIFFAKSLHCSNTTVHCNGFVKTIKLCKLYFSKHKLFF